MKKVNNTNRNTRLKKRPRENILIKLIEQHNSLEKKEKYMDLNYDDLQYQGIGDIKNTLAIINVDSYYEPELIASAFDKHYERYRINGDKDKELSLNTYVDTVRQNAVELITKKNIGERNVQLVISILFINYLDNEKVEKYIYKDNVITRTTDDLNIITTSLDNSLVKNINKHYKTKWKEVVLYLIM